jgi:hypothetical protein
MYNTISVAIAFRGNFLSFGRKLCVPSPRERVHRPADSYTDQQEEEEEGEVATSVPDVLARFRSFPLVQNWVSISASNIHVFVFLDPLDSFVLQHRARPGYFSVANKSDADPAGIDCI